MAESSYRVVFEGELSGDLPEHAVKQNLASLFRMPQTRVEDLFSGRRVVLKKDVDGATAKRFESALAKAGAACRIEAMPGRDGEAGAQAPEPAAAPQAGGAEAGGEGHPGSSTTAAGDPNRTVVPLEVPEDLGDLALDDSEEPLGRDRGEGAPEIDTSGLSLEPDR
jgi:hypothetical protein